MDETTFNLHLKQLVKIKLPYGLSTDCNPRVTPILKAKPCEDCNLDVVGRSVEYVIKGLNSHNPYWTKKCNNCKEKFGKISRKDII